MANPEKESLHKQAAYPEQFYLQLLRMVTRCDVVSRFYMTI